MNLTKLTLEIDDLERQLDELVFTRELATCICDEECIGCLSGYDLQIEAVEKELDAKYSLMDSQLGIDVHS